MRKRPDRWSGEFNRLGTNEPRRGDILIAGCVSIWIDGAIRCFGGIFEAKQSKIVTKQKIPDIQIYLQRKMIYVKMIKL